jgi:hypothetical protein
MFFQWLRDAGSVDGRWMWLWSTGGMTTDRRKSWYSDRTSDARKQWHSDRNGGTRAATVVLGEQQQYSERKWYRDRNSGTWKVVPGYKMVLGNSGTRRNNGSRWNSGTWTKTPYSAKTVYHKSNMYCPGTEAGTPRLETGHRRNRLSCGNVYFPSVSINTHYIK